MINFFLSFMAFLVLEATNHKVMAHEGFQASNLDVTPTELEEENDDSETILARMSENT